MSARQAVTESQRSAKHSVTFWIRRLHMYLGLLNFSLLIVFGVAGLAATGDVPELFSEPSSVASHPFTPPPNASDREVAPLIAALIQPNHAGDPVVRRNDSNQLVTDFNSINGRVRATLFESEHRVEVRTFRNSIWRFIDNAHATTISQRKRDSVVLAWAWYIEFSIWSLALMAISGVWLGVASRWNSGWTRASLAAGAAAFLILYYLER
jgi:hypothetical protein